MATAYCQNDFYPRPPRGGRPEDGWVEEAVLTISIHALREEGDWQAGSAQVQLRYFYPRPPRGGRLCYLMDGRWTTLISIHALREEGDSGTVANYSKTKAISIHALREEGDLAGLEVTSFERQFLSTPSARRATRSSIVYHFSWSFLSTPSARRATQEKHT